VAADFLAAEDRRAAAAHRGAGDVEITPQDHHTIADAIHAAEQRTSGQIVCVLAHASDDYAHVPLIWASFLALLVPWPLIYLTAWSVQRIFLCQLIVFIIAAAVFWWWPIRLALVPRAVRRVRAHRAAIEQFFIRRVAHTPNRCGVLIFVSLAEHYVRIVADDGIAAKVGAEEWQSAVDALIGHVRDGRITEGFVAAIERCGAVLAEHAPPDGSPNALPDRLYIM
jgi:putative membrane protein